MLKKWAPIKLALVFLAISSCGWQLRDSSLLGINLGAVSISYPESQNTIGIELKRELQANNVQIVGAADKASYKLKIIDTTQSQRVSARNENARAAQYQIYLAVDYIVVDALGAEVIPMTTASAESSYNFDENDIFASHNEEVVLQDNLRTKIVRQIIFRLGELSESIAGQL